MSYQTLYRKYRSQTFAELVGQEATSRALQGAIVQDRIAHAYLFSGTRGTGKTSTARILARALNCEHREPGSAEPCNRCESCRQTLAGAALDLIEIDAASNRGIDEIRELREKVNLAPALGRFKVYIVDEAHMLTLDAFNALLKTLEEPPPHVVFVLCTTEAQKVPATVLGRCQQFVFRRLSEGQIVRRLEQIAAAEGIAVETPALELVARVAQGSMRDAVGMFDQLIPLAQGPITPAGARELLGIADPARLDRLWELVLAEEPGRALAELSSIYEAGGELRPLVRGLMERCRDRLIEAIEGRDAELRERLSGILEALLHLDGEVRRHGEPRFLVEATLVRLAVAGAPKIAGPALDPAAEAVPEPRSATASAGASQPAAPPPGAGSPSEPPAGWPGVLEALDFKTRALFKEARPSLEGSVLALVFPYSFHYQRASETLARLQPLVRAWLGESAKLELRLEEGQASPGASGPPSATVAVGRSPIPEEDPVVRAAERRLEARVVRVRRLREPH